MRALDLKLALLISATLAVCSVTPSRAASVLAQTVLTRPPEQIAELSFDASQFEIRAEETKDDQFELRSKISGYFRRSESALLLGSTQVNVDPETKHFEVDVLFDAASIRLEFSAVDNDGKVQQEGVTAGSVPPDPIEQALKAYSEKQTFFETSVNTSYLSYTDNAGNDFNQLAFGIKGGVSRFLDKNKKQQIAGNLYGTVLTPFTSRTDSTLRQIGANIRYGRQVADGPGWRLWVHGGYFFVTTVSQNSKIGFSGLLAPQIYPSVAVPLPRFRTLNAYVKLAPFYGLSFESRELAFGVSINQRELNGRNKGLSLDFSNIRLSADPAVIQLSNFVFSYSLGF